MRVYQPEKIHRVILKLSGEYLAGSKGFGFDSSVLEFIAEEIISSKKLGLSLGIVLGGGNFFRGGDYPDTDRVVGDSVGMLATIQNALILGDVLRKKNYNTEIYSAIQVDKVAKFYTPKRAETSMKEGKICFFCGGTGNPFFTTDTAAVLRAVELKADLVMKGTKVDGVYSADPKKDKNAQFIEDITYDETLARHLNVMDMTAFSLARDYDMPLKVFNIGVKGNLKAAILSKEVGTFVHN